MSPQRLYELDLQFGSKIHTVFSTMDAIEEHVLEADLVIGAVLVAGAAAPKLVSAEMVKRMRRGAVMVDVSIDQGGCFETSRPTSHAEPTYIVDDVVHYCVTNMPGAMARTSTFALNNATIAVCSGPGRQRAGGKRCRTTHTWRTGSTFMAVS